MLRDKFTDGDHAVGANHDAVVVVPIQEFQFARADDPIVERPSTAFIVRRKPIFFLPLMPIEIHDRAIQSAGQLAKARDPHRMAWDKPLVRFREDVADTGEQTGLGE